MKNASYHLSYHLDDAEPLSTEETVITLDLGEPIWKKCDFWFHNGYTDKNEKQVGCQVNVDGVQAFSDT